MAFLLSCDLYLIKQHTSEDMNILLLDISYDPPSLLLTQSSLLWSLLFIYLFSILGFLSFLSVPSPFYITIILPTPYTIYNILLSSFS